VFLVASGLVPRQTGMLEIVDSQGGKKDLAYPGTGNAQLYDPFIRVIKTA